MPRKITIQIPDKRLVPKTLRRISFRAFLCILFRQNDKFARTKEEQPWSDEVIREICRTKFPRNKSIAKMYTKDESKKSINYYRNAFNRGALEKTIDYKLYPFISLRYDEWGNVVNPRSGLMELTPQEIDDIIFSSFHERLKRGVHVPDEIVKKLESLYPMSPAFQHPQTGNL